MIPDLSSKITLERIPERYYHPADALDAVRQSRKEKIKTEIFETADAGALNIARQMAALISSTAGMGRKCVLGLAGGTSPISVYKHLVQIYRQEKFSFSHVHVFVIAEFCPLSENASHSNTKVVVDNLLSKVDFPMEQLYSPNSIRDKSEVVAFCRNFELQMENLGGLDFVLTSIGVIGNIAYNEPGSQLSSTTRLMLLDNQSRKDLKHFYLSPSQIPASAVTVGVSTFMNAREVIVMGWGESKAPVLKEMIEGKVDDNIPASFLQMHKNARVVVDLGAAQQLTRISRPWLVGSCEWTDKLIRRAIVWLCEVTEKPILKLTNKDYNQYGLDELLALHGSAYNANIKVFNELQHTITGWPGGKPGADDTYRPERALPYPKKVMVFSPHPDDDVISMGGTFQRLVDQQHEVHVAYQTSGNIAVGDEEIIRSVSLMKNVLERFNPENEALPALYNQVLHFLQAEKQPGQSDIADVLFLKGQLRREEARSACRFVGLKPEHVHFLDLPFYETGKVKKGDLSDADVEIIVKLLRKVQPQQIFVAGDLADPHGTHKVCLDAILAALHEMQHDVWLKDCRIWMYRGAWAEWEIDHIEMAVPMSPEQLRQKRNSILKHQSQMESAPFMGNDERLFWQRAEDRNRATAELYHKLGLASYEAIEAFVEYKMQSH